MNSHLQRGFTILEMLIALALFALIGVLGFQILQSVVRNGELSQQHVGRLMQAQRVFSLLEQDIAQAREIPPAATTTAGAAIVNRNQQLTLLRHNWLNPGGFLPRSALEQVKWLMGEHGLERRSFVWPQQIQTESSVHFSAVRVMNLRYWFNGRWLDNWFAAHVLPHAIEVSLELEGYGTLQRVIFITGGA